MIFSKKLNHYKNVSHCFFNKVGGRSKGIYKSLNCGTGSLDKRKDVKKNIKLACNKLNNSYKKLILLNQIHSNKFHYVKNISSIRKKLVGDTKTRYYQRPKALQKVKKAKKSTKFN